MEGGLGVGEGVRGGVVGGVWGVILVGGVKGVGGVGERVVGGMGVV